MKLFIAMSGLVAALAAPVAQAGGLAEPEPEPRVMVPDEPLQRTVRPTRPAEQESCRWVTVAVTTDAPQWFGNQGLAVSGCCCGVITIPGNSFSLGGQSSVRQELVCNGEENS